MVGFASHRIVVPTDTRRPVVLLCHVVMIAGEKVPLIKIIAHWFVILQSYSNSYSNLLHRNNHLAINTGQLVDFDVDPNSLMRNDPVFFLQKYIKDFQVPLIIGTNKNEGLLIKVKKIPELFFVNFMDFCVELFSWTYFPGLLPKRWRWEVNLCL